MNHFSTLRNARSRRVLWAAIFILYVVPVLAGLLGWNFNFRLKEIGDLIGGLALFSGFLFALVIFVFQLRLTVTNDPRVQQKALLPQLIDELFANVAYSVIVAVVAAGAAMVASSFNEFDKSGTDIGLTPLLSSILLALTLHLVLMILFCLKRTVSAYRELKS